MCFSGTSVMSSVSLSVVPLLCFTSGAVGSLTSLLGGGWKSLGKLSADWDGSFWWGVGTHYCNSGCFVSLHDL